MNVDFDEKLRIDECLTWGMLKYGLCSYFVLAYVKKYPILNRFLAIMEYDSELEKEYLVHFLVISDDYFIDAEEKYVNWENSIKQMTDVEFMEFRIKIVNESFVRKLIEKDMGFDEQLFKLICNFVNKAY